MQIKNGGILKTILTRLTVLLLSILIFSGTLFINSPKALAYDRNNLCDDNDFVNWQTLDAEGVQSFLVSKGSFLRNFSHNGRSAAQIIYDAARNNRVNPIAILAMIQKEEGIVYGQNARSFNQTRVDWAMGYGYTDSTIYTQYKGFTSQIDNGTWQLKRNYDYWASNGSAWNVGKTMTIDGTSVRFANRCTSAQYRYTPHLGTNFAYYFSLWNRAFSGKLTYDARKISQSSNRTIRAGQQFTVTVNYRNTGTATWYKTGVNATHLGNWAPMDRRSVFQGGENIRTELKQSKVRPGGVGTFRLNLTAPSQAGTYVEKFRPVTEQIAWHSNEVIWTFKVRDSGGVSPAVNGVHTTNPSTYNAQYISQGPRSGAGSPSYTLTPGQQFTVTVNYRNTGTATWYKIGVNATHLGNWAPMDRRSAFEGNENIRAELIQTSVRPGQIGTFKYRFTAPSQAGTYVEKFRPVTEQIAWHGDEMSWTFKVR